MLRRYRNVKISLWDTLNIYVSSLVVNKIYNYYTYIKTSEKNDPTNQIRCSLFIYIPYAKIDSTHMNINYRTCFSTHLKFIFSICYYWDEK